MDCISFTNWLENRDMYDVSVADKALKHTAQCPECSRKFDLDEQLDQLIRNALQPVDMPESLISRVDMSLDHVKSSDSGSKYKWLGGTAAVAAALALFIAVFFSSSPSILSMDEFGKYAIGDHLGHGDAVLVVDRLADVNTLEGVSVDGDIIARAMPAQYKFVGARICPLGDCPAVHIVLNNQDKRVSLYVVSKKEVGFSLAEGREYTVTLENQMVKLSWMESKDMML